MIAIVLAIYVVLIIAIILIFVCSLSFLYVSLVYQVEPSRFLPECSGRGFVTEGQVPPRHACTQCSGRGFVTEGRTTSFVCQKPLLTLCCSFFHLAELQPG